MERTLQSSRAGRRLRGRNGASLAAARSAEWHELVVDVEDLLKKVAHIGDAEVTRVRAKVEQTLQSAKNAAVQTAASIRERAHDATEAADEYVHESPWRAVGIAAAVGALLGFLVARR